MLKRDKGITLIALIITIIVLIILAAVALGVLTGDNGIITRAMKAREDTGTQQEAEFVNLITSKIRIEEKTGETVTEENLQEYIDEVLGTGKATGTISTSNNVTIYTIAVTNGGTYTITNTDVTKQEEIEPVDPTKVERGVFVKYDVAYSDMYIEQNYNTTNGWRLVDYTYNTETGKYDDVKLISTGIPAVLYYRYNGGNNSWFETNSEKLGNFITTLGTTAGNNTYTTYSSANSTYSNYPGLKASLGLYQSSTFETINYKYGTSASGAWGSDANGYNRGYYKAITNGTGTNINEYGSSTANAVTGSNLFSVGGEKVRLLTLPEVNKFAGIMDNDNTNSLPQQTGKETGLLRLDNLGSIEGANLTSYSGFFGYWWLASPWPSTYQDYNHICCLGISGGIGDGDGTTWQQYHGSRGIRPAIILGNNIIFTDSNNDGVLEYKR